MLSIVAFFRCAPTDRYRCGGHLPTDPDILMPQKEYRNCFLRRHVKHTSYYRKHTMRDKRIAKKAADALAGGRAGTAFFDICSAAQISMDGGRYVMGAGDVYKRQDLPDAGSMGLKLFDTPITL